MEKPFVPLRMGWLVGALALCVIATNGCNDGGSSDPPVGTDAAETSAAMSQQALVGLETVLSFEALGGAGAVLDGAEDDLGGASRLGLFDRLDLNRRLSILATGAANDVAAAVEQCPDGGSVSEDCTATDTQSTYEFSASNCKESFEGATFVSNGSIVLVADDPSACDVGIENVDGFSSTFNNLSFSVNAQGQVLLRVVADGTIAVTGDTSIECGSAGGSLMGNYSIEIFSADEAVNLRVEAKNLDVVVAPGADPCEHVITIDGELYVVDRVADERLRQTFDALQVTVFQGDLSTTVSIDGASSLNCMGSVQYETVEPLVFLDGTDCPVGGVLRVTIVDTEEVALIYFNEDGSVDIDLGEDGTLDRSRASCDDIRPACRA